MSNPFDAPQQDSAAQATISGPGDFDIAMALQDGISATRRYFLPWLGVMLTTVLISFVAIIMCFLPFLVALPALIWGSTKFYLQAVDGNAEYKTIFEGFNKIGDVLLPVWAVLVILGVIGYIPSPFTDAIAPVIIPGFETLQEDAMKGDFTGLGIYLAFSTLVGMIWNTLILVRLQPVLMLVVDKAIGPVEAVTIAWRLTSTCWLKLIGFTILTNLIGVISMAPVIGGLVLLFLGAQQGSYALIGGAGVLGLLGLVLPFLGAMVIAGGGASVYRQLLGERVA